MATHFPSRGKVLKTHDQKCLYNQWKRNRSLLLSKDNVREILLQSKDQKKMGKKKALRTKEKLDESLNGGFLGKYLEERNEIYDAIGVDVYNACQCPFSSSLLATIKPKIQQSSNPVPADLKLSEDDEDELGASIVAEKQKDTLKGLNGFADYSNYEKEGNKQENGTLIGEESGLEPQVTLEGRNATKQSEQQVERFSIHEVMSVLHQDLELSEDESIIGSDGKAAGSEDSKKSQSVDKNSPTMNDDNDEDALDYDYDEYDIAALYEKYN